jgi:hypothetical protein
MTTVKITELTEIGANLATSTVVPVVNMAGTPTTQKTTVGNIANLILEGAGVDYPEASVALLAQTVSNAAQPNITSVGTLTTLAVSGNASVNGNLTSNGTAYVGNLSTTGIASITTLSVGATANLGAVGNVTITGGTAGQVLSTDGAGNLSWASDATTYGNSNVAAYLPTYTGNIGANVVTANLFVGSGANLTNIAGVNVSGFVPNANVANTAFAVAAANVSGLGNIAVSNYDGNASNVLHGDGSWSADTTTYGNSNVAAYLPTFTGNIGANVISANLFVGSGANLTNIAGGNVVGAVPYATTANLVAGANVSGQVNYASIANSVAGVNVSGQVNFAATANSVAAANVSGLGNIATINLDGNISNALLGNGAWGPVEVNVNSIYNGTSSVQIPSSNGNVSINVGSNSWSFTTDGDVHLPGNSYLLTSGELGFLVAANEAFEITTSNSANYSWFFNPDGSLLIPEQLSGRTSIFSRDSNANTTSFVSFPTASSSNLTLGTNDNHNVVINTDHSNANLRWTFDNTGNLIIPGSSGGFIKTIANSSIGIAAMDNGTNNPAQLLLIDAGTGNAETIISAYNSNATIQTNASGAINTWSFDNSGNLTLPGSLIATSASPAPTINGFSITNSAGISGNGNIAGNNISATSNISGNTNGYTIGYLNIPQVAASNTTLALGDAGKHYYSTTAGNFTLTVPNNATTAFATGTAISIVVQAAGNILVNADTGVTLYMAGNSTAANRVVGGYGMATLMKVGTDTWFINGTGVS